MQVFAETERVLLREMLSTDDLGMFELDNDREVHQYLGNQPITLLEQARENIENIRGQYRENGIARWAVIEKSTGKFIGWAGLKLITEPVNNHIDYYDLGYRFIKEYWGRGFATECAKASLKYGFEILRPGAIYAMAHIDNTASRHVLEKCGLTCLETFDYSGITKNWFTITREEWLSGQS